MFHYLQNPTDLRKEVGEPNAVRLVVITGETGSGVEEVSAFLGAEMNAKVFSLQDFGSYDDVLDTSGIVRRRFMIRPFQVGEAVIETLLSKQSAVIAGSADNMAALYWVIRKVMKSRDTRWLYVLPDVGVWHQICPDKGRARTSPSRWKERRRLRYKLALTLVINCLAKDEDWLSDIVQDDDRRGLLGTGLLEKVNSAGVSTVELEREVGKLFGYAGLFSHQFTSQGIFNVSQTVKPQPYGH